MRKEREIENVFDSTVDSVKVGVAVPLFVGRGVYRALRPTIVGEIQKSLNDRGHHGWSEFVGMVLLDGEDGRYVKR